MEIKNAFSENLEIRGVASPLSSACSCPHCLQTVQPGQLVCSTCGSRTSENADEAKKLKISEQLDKELLSLGRTIAMANAADNSLLYMELGREIQCMRKILAIAKHSPSGDNHTNRQIRRLAGSFLSKSQSVFMEIALVGTVKAGKSSLINAFIGTELASVDAVPETSVLTKYRTTKSGNYLKVRFYNDADWRRIWQSASKAETFLAEYERTGAESVRKTYLGKKPRNIQFANLDLLREGVMKWTKSDSPEHFFVKELEVGYESDTFPHDVFFVDTPGLDDPVKYRSDITRRYISKSDWTLACITAENLSEKSELSFLSRVIANRNGNVEQIFTIITKKDQLDPRDLDRKRELFLSQISRMYGNREMAESHTFVLSAIGHSLTMKALSGLELSREDKRRLRKVLADLDYDLDEVEQFRDDILEYAGVQALYTYLNTNSVQQARGIIVRRIRENYQHCVQAIRSLTQDHLELYQDYLNSIVTSQEELEKQIQKVREAKQPLRDKQDKARRLNDELERQIAAAERNRR